MVIKNLQGKEEKRRRWKVSTVVVNRDTHCGICTDLVWHPGEVGQPVRPKRQPQPAIYLQKIFRTHFKYARIFALEEITSHEDAVKRLDELKKTKDFLTHMIQFYESTNRPSCPMSKRTGDDEAFMDVYFGTLFDFVLESIRCLEAEFPAWNKPNGRWKEKAVQTDEPLPNQHSPQFHTPKAEMGDKRSDEGYDEINLASSAQIERELMRNGSVRKSLGRAKKVVIYYD